MIRFGGHPRTVAENFIAGLKFGDFEFLVQSSNFEQQLSLQRQKLQYDLSSSHHISTATTMVAWMHLLLNVPHQILLAVSAAKFLLLVNAGQYTAGEGQLTPFTSFAYPCKRQSSRPFQAAQQHHTWYLAPSMVMIVAEIWGVSNKVAFLFD